MDSALLARHKEAYNSGNNENRSTAEQTPRERFLSLWIGWEVTEQARLDADREVEGFWKTIVERHRGTPCKI